MEIHRGPCVSVFMTMHRSGSETQQDPIRFKNLLREAEEHKDFPLPRQGSCWSRPRNFCRAIFSINTKATDL
jgi:hypothetical protein